MNGTLLRRLMNRSSYEHMIICSWIVLGMSGCVTVIEPGHRGLVFSRGGLQQHILGEGRHRLGVTDRVVDFDVTYSTRHEELNTTSSEGLAVSFKVAVIFRPIVSELYDLDVEIGANYYDEVLGPELRSAATGVLAHHSYTELQRTNEKVEDEIEAAVRRRINGKHVEISSVTLESIDYAPEIAAVTRARIVGEQDAIRRKAQQEADAQRQANELKHQAEREQLQTEAEIRQKEKERKLAEEQAAIERVQADTEAQTKLTRAKAEAAAISALADAHAKEKRAEATALTPLMVQMHAYDALAKLGGNGTTILLGDWSKVPSFLFPGMPGGLKLSAAR
jgi:regulator of protease activity HflC (stomatin/prohibitin superfamily)